MVGITSGNTSIFNSVANLLLISTGTLSTFSKQIGTILPKMRTPQTGLSIRSFSHHITFHETEVEIMWRMFPWANIQENTLNILSVCWPNKINNSFFSSTSETFKSVRYFEFSVDSMEGEDKFKPIEIIKIIEGYRRKGIERIHMLVLPEIALNEEEWSNLLQELSIFYKECMETIKQIPIVISGVRRRIGNEANSPQTNELRIASFFADKWYTISQRKHHRWQLDGNQIRQYELSGRFSTSRKWFENIEISQRRLSIVSPNGWLSLCPLICEDLAQLEPVSSVIRGIGPTILIALLADGPQLKERWSARYASVFADDPGTSVLTVTSAGMVKKSTPKDGKKADNLTLALWKDQITGVKTVEDIDQENSYCKNFLITVSSQWVEEFTADGRTDHQNASVIKYESLSHLNNKDIGEIEEKLLADFEEKTKNKDGTYIDRDWNDIREISSALAITDSLIELADKKYIEFVNILFRYKEKKSNLVKKNKKQNKFYFDLLELIHASSIDPLNAGILAEQFNESSQKNRPKFSENKWPTLSYQAFFLHLEAVYTDFCDRLGDENGKSKYEILYEVVSKELSNLESIDSNEIAKKLISINGQATAEHPELLTPTMIARMRKACLLQMLILIHNKLESNRKQHKTGSQIHSRINDKKGIKSFSRNRNVQLFDKIERILIQNGY